MLRAGAPGQEEGATTRWQVQVCHCGGGLGVLNSRCWKEAGRGGCRGHQCRYERASLGMGSDKVAAQVDMILSVWTPVGKCLKKMSCQN